MKPSDIPQQGKPVKIDPQPVQEDAGEPDAPVVDENPTEDQETPTEPPVTDEPAPEPEPQVMEARNTWEDLPPEDQPVRYVSTDPWGPRLETPTPRADRWTPPGLRPDWAPTTGDKKPQPARRPPNPRRPKPQTRRPRTPGERNTR